jgi:hypothetical protein
MAWAEGRNVKISANIGKINDLRGRFAGACQSVVARLALILAFSTCWNDSVGVGSAVVSTTVFGVSPKSSPVPVASPIGDVAIIVGLAGETPARATGTVALPNPSDSFRA